MVKGRGPQKTTNEVRDLEEALYAIIFKTVREKGEGIHFIGKKK